jgi:mono/diheme cytochrome c family protein
MRCPISWNNKNPLVLNILIVALMRSFILILSGTLLFSSCKQDVPQQMTEEEILKSGAAAFSRFICNTCHSLEGEEIYGPPLNGLYMKKVEVIRDGKVITVTANRDYLKKAILDPRSEEVAGYQSKDMPEVHISEKEADLLVEYLVLMGKNDSSVYR